jgi:hypothetical protein
MEASAVVEIVFVEFPVCRGPLWNFLLFSTFSWREEDFSLVEMEQRREWRAERNFPLPNSGHMSHYVMKYYARNPLMREAGF